MIDKEVLSDSGGDTSNCWDVMMDQSPRSMVKDFCPAAWLDKARRGCYQSHYKYELLVPH